MESAEAPEPHYMRGSHRGRYTDIFLNGNYFFRKRILYNQKHFRDLDHLLDHISDNIRPSFGAVRHLYSTSGRHRVRSLDDLTDRNLFVAVGGCDRKFRPYQYEQIDSTRKRSQPPPNYDVGPGHSRKYQVSGRCRKLDMRGKLIKCWMNGDKDNGPKTVLLSAQHNMSNTLEGIKQQVADAFQCGQQIPNLYVRSTKIQVMSMDQIIPNERYVLVYPGKSFLEVPYRETNRPPMSMSPRQLRRELPPLPPRSNKTSSNSSPEHSIGSNNGSEKGYSQRYRRERGKREEDQVFHAKPVQHKRSSDRARQVDYDQDNGGVFKAKSQNRATKGARQVEDSRNVKTDLPVDQQAARQVKEDLKEKDKKDKKGKKDNGRVSPHQQRPYRPNARRADSPTNEPSYRPNARRADSPTNERALREAKRQKDRDDQERLAKTQQQQEAARQKRREKEEKKKREEEEERKRQEEARRRRKEVEEERREREEEERRWREEEGEKRKTGGRWSDRKSQNGRDNSPARDERSTSDIFRQEQDDLAAMRDQAATKIQASYRGYRTRRNLKLKKAEEAMDRALEDPIPLDTENDWGPSPVSYNPREEEEEREKAAIKIQSGFRGAKARREAQAIRERQEVKESPPLPTTSSPARPDSPAAHSPLSQADADHAAALMLQATLGPQRGKSAGSQAAAASPVEGGTSSGKTQH